MAVTTKILSCVCKHTGSGLVQSQDDLYGTGNRVFNATSKPNLWRCTVCKKERIVT